MPENSDQPGKSDDVINQETPMVNQEEDGRNKEWQDRSRVNVEQVPEGTKTNIERDFEPEKSGEEKKGNDGSNY